MIISVICIKLLFICWLDSLGFVLISYSSSCFFLKGVWFKILIMNGWFCKDFLWLIVFVIFFVKFLLGMLFCDVLIDSVIFLF